MSRLQRPRQDALPTPWQRVVIRFAGMDRWSIGGALVVITLALGACQLLNPKWDPSADGGNTSTGSTTLSDSAEAGGVETEGNSTSPSSSQGSEGEGSSTTSADTAATDSSNSSDSSASTTDITSSSSSGGAECRTIDGECAENSECCPCSTCVEGTCQADEGASCGECQVCDGGGACVLEIEGSACGEAIDCTALSCGPDPNGRCLACTGQEFGRCNADGACVPATAAGCADNGEGDVAIDCTVSCIKDEGACPQFVPLETLTADDFCLNDGSVTEGCRDLCKNEALYSQVQHFRCWEGGCKTQGEKIDCDNYRCDLETDVCYDSCTKSDQCTFTFTCQGNECLP